VSGPASTLSGGGSRREARRGSAVRPQPPQVRPRSAPQGTETETAGATCLAAPCSARTASMRG
jgi:hypothetical protein